MHKMIAGLLAVAALFLATAVFAAPNMTNPTADINLTNPPDCYGYFVKNPAFPAPSDATLTDGATWADVNAADAIYNLSIVGDLANDLGKARDTEYIAYGSNVPGMSLTFLLNIDNAVQGDWVLEANGAGPISIDPGVPLALFLNPSWANRDIVSPVALSVNNVGIEGAAGSWAGTLNLTVATIP